MGELILLFIITFLTSTTSLLVKNKKGFLLNFILSFSGAFLLGITLLHIFPELYFNTQSVKTIGVFIMVGFFIQVLLESYSKGIEHGHIHIHDFGKMPYGLFLALSLHALLEGSVLKLSDNEFLHLITAILIHKIPVAFLLGVLLFTIKQNKLISILLLIFFALATPIGSIISTNLSFQIFGLEITQLLMAMATGSFLHVSTTILFETSPEHKLKINKFFPALLGGILAILSVNLHIH